MERVKELELTLDTYGNPRIFGRTKDLIKSGAEFIPSAKVESPLSKAPGVELAVAGRADPKWDERPVALIKPRANIPFDPVKVKEHLDAYVAEGKLNRWWVPEEFVPIGDMPMTGTGKVDKKGQRERLAGR